MEINIDDMAREIARDIFKSGDLEGKSTQRIQFMGGHYPDHETRHGGLCETALMQVIKGSLRRNGELKCQKK